MQKAVFKIARRFVPPSWRIWAREIVSGNPNEIALMGSIFDRPGQMVDVGAPDTIAEARPFYVSPVSSGISSLHHFHPSHRDSGKVAVTTLDAALVQHGVATIDFLKIDIEGLDLFALRGLSTAWPVRAVICEFEDRKTRSLGYDAADLGDLLVARGFHVIVSLWHPIVEYGRQHRWRAFVRYPCIIPGDSWGNFLGFLWPEDAARFENFARRCGRTVRD